MPQSHSSTHKALKWPLKVKIAVQTQMGTQEHWTLWVNSCPTLRILIKAQFHGMSAGPHQVLCYCLTAIAFKKSKNWVKPAGPGTLNLLLERGCQHMLKVDCRGKTETGWCLSPGRPAQLSALHWLFLSTHRDKNTSPKFIKNQPTPKNNSMSRNALVKE